MDSQTIEQLSAAYSGILAQEEQQRCEAWQELLMRHTPRESGVQYGLQQLAEMSLQDLITQAADPHCELSKTIPPLVHGGFPGILRGLGWRLLLDVSVRRHKGHYAVLVEQLGELATKQELSAEDIKAHMQGAKLQSNNHPSDTNGANSDTAHSQSSSEVSAWQSQAAVWLQQIEKDLPRTFAGHPMMQGPGRPALRRVLAAYTMLDPHIGYCQGMNFIAAVLLMFMSEEDAFWCLVIIVEQVLKGYFTPDMMATKVDQRVFQQLVSSQIPAVAVHLEVVGADIACVFAQWFLCAFVNSLPLETCLRVWDVLFYQKSSAVLFQVGLALVDMYSEALLAAKDLLEAFQVVQSMAALTHDATRLLALAMVKYSAVDDAQLSVMRQQARAQLEKEEEQAEADRQLRGLGDSSKLQGINSQPDTRVSVVKKFLARLDKRLDNSGSSDRGVGRGVDSPSGAAGDSDEEVSEQGIVGIARSMLNTNPPQQPTGEAATQPQGRAGNHSIPDASDAPLLKAGNGAVAAGANVALGSVNGHGADPASLVLPAATQQQDDVLQGSYVPPSVPLFPETKDFISLSPSESTAVPDIDDLLRGGSLRYGALGSQSKHASNPAAVLLSTVESGASTPSHVVGRASQESTRLLQDNRPSVGQVGSRAADDNDTSDALPLESPKVSLVKDQRLKALDRVLWSDEVLPDLLNRPASAPTAAAGLNALPAADVPARSQTPLIQQSTAAPSSHTPTADHAGTTATATASTGNISTQSKLSNSSVQAPAMCSAMVRAVQIAMQHTGQSQDSMQAVNGNTATHPPDLLGSPVKQPYPAHPAPHLSHIRTVELNSNSAGSSGPRNQAGHWGVDAAGSATSAFSIGLSSVPTEDLDALHIASQVQRNSASVSGVLNSHGFGDLKDDWVDLHVGEDLGVHPHSSAHVMSPSGHVVNLLPGLSASRGSHAASVSPLSFAQHHSSAGAGHASAVRPPVLQPMIHSMPVPQPDLRELRKTTSSGWVDGSLLSYSSQPLSTAAGTQLANPQVATTQLTQQQPVYLPSRMPSFGPAVGLPLTPLDREPNPNLPPGISTVNQQQASMDLVLESCKRVAGLPLDSPVDSRAVDAVCEREGIQPLLARCSALNAQYNSIHATQAGEQQGSAAAVEGMMQTLINLQQLIQQARASLSSTTQQVSSDGSSNQNTLSGTLSSINNTLSLALQMVTSGVEEAQQHSTNPEAQLLHSYQELSSQSCQKLHDLGVSLVEHETVMNALKSRVHELQQRLHLQESYIGGSIATPQLSPTVVPSLYPSSQQAHGVESQADQNPNRLIGAFNKLKERAPRAISPKPATGWAGLQPPTSTYAGGGWSMLPGNANTMSMQPVGSHPLMGMASGQSTGSGTWGHGRSEDGTGAREEGRVTKWLSKFMKKEDGETMLG